MMDNENDRYVIFHPTLVSILARQAVRRRGLLCGGGRARMCGSLICWGSHQDKGDPSPNTAVTSFAVGDTGPVAPACCLRPLFGLCRSEAASHICSMIVDHLLMPCPVMQMTDGSDLSAMAEHT